MASLLDLTQQGDVATISDDAYLKRSLQLMTPQQLYELWERQQWQSQAIDFTQDRRDWEALSDEERDEAIYTLSAFFVGEERVTTEFSGLVMAYDDEQEEAFLTTQQVDEARHMQFFDRFHREVLSRDGNLHDRLARAREDVTDAFNTLFDKSLVDSARRLIADPKDRLAKIDFITAYHMVIEGTLALTGQYFLLRFCEERGILPGFAEGFGNVARDEHRHVAYGTWYLQQQSEDPEVAKRIQDTLVELLPEAAGVLVPPGYSLGDEYTILGYTSQEQNEYAFTALTRRLKVIGVGLPVAA
jgi:ribonucleoside-diphosphate reductase beta chain